MTETPPALPDESGLTPNAPQDAATQIFDLVQAGGPVVTVLIAMSVVALTVILAKLWQFAQIRIGDRRTGREAVRLLRGDRIDEALSLAANGRNPTAQALARAVRGLQRGIPEARVREEVLRYGGEALESLRGGFRTLEVVASIAPLLGLFGTVLGMIEAFQQLEAAGSQVNPAVLSGGIWQALLTTAVGLAVAIPVVAILNGLERAVDGLAHEMDSVVTQVFTEDLSADMQQKDNEGYGGAGIHSATARA